MATSKEKKDKKEKKEKKGSEGRKASKAEEEARERREAAEAARKRKVEVVEKSKKEKKSKGEKDQRREQGGAADATVNGEKAKAKESKVKEKAQKEKGKEKVKGKVKEKAKEKEREKTKEKLEKLEKEQREKDAELERETERLLKQKQERERLEKERLEKEELEKAEKAKLEEEKLLEEEKEKRGAEEANSDAASGSSETSGEKRRKRREDAGLKPATGFAPAVYDPSQLPEAVKGLLEQKESLAQEVARMKLAVEAATGLRAEEPAETTLKMPTRLTEHLMEPENLEKLLKKTNLQSASLNEEKHLLLRAPSRKQLQKTLGQLKRVAYACQWGCSSEKVGVLLSEKPAKALNSIVLRLTSTSSHLSSHEAKLTAKMRKIRMGTGQVGAGMLQLEGIPGLSRKHCTITFEPPKGACYVQDVSTNGTFLNGKRLPRPPFKHPSDARVRLFHGDELLFKLRTDEAEELGYVINLVELS